MSLPQDLLDQARHLATLEQTRPKQASLRRSVSASYYALFHLLNSSSAAIIAPNVSIETNHRIQRWFDHAEMKKVCGRFLPTKHSAPLLQRIGSSASADLQLVCRAFIEMQESRHSADYDLSWTITRSEVLQYLERTQTAFQAWERLEGSAEANIFILSLLLWKNWDRERL